MLDPHISWTWQGEYDVRALQITIQALVERLPGGWDWIRPGDRVLLKPNLLRPNLPDEAITTHPSVVEATARLIRDAGGVPILAESPAAPYTQKILNWVYDRCGIREASQRCETTLNLDTTALAVSNPEGKILKHVEIIRPLLEADSVINLAKAKSHCFTVLTGAVKNLFGFIPGLRKAGYHATLKEPYQFADMLLDLVTLAKPALSILDGIVGMEGDGPSAGEPRHMGFLVMGRSPVHVDWAFSRLVGVQPTFVPVLEAAMHRGWLNTAGSIIEEGPAPLPEAAIEGFRLPQTLDPLGFLGRLPFQRLLYSMITSMCTMKPYIPETACKGCGVCQQNCPVAAIETDSGRARIDHTRCIRCYCCHEVCPEKIVEVRGSLFYRCLRPLSGRIAQRAR